MVFLFRLLFSNLLASPAVFLIGCGTLLSSVLAAVEGASGATIPLLSAPLSLRLFDLSLKLLYRSAAACLFCNSCLDLISLPRQNADSLEFLFPLSSGPFSLSLSGPLDGFSLSGSCVPRTRDPSLFFSC